MNHRLEVRGLCKRFPGVQALDRVDFTARAGGIHALMGENGAGKSTLIKVITGVHAPDGGSVHLDGREVRPRSPKDAEALGIRTVYQEVNLVPHRSVAENLCLGREPTRFGLIQWREVRRRATASLERIGRTMDLGRELGSLSMADQQLVAIARAMDGPTRLLILDEPTSSLDAEEVAELFAVLRRLRDEGMAIVFITHFLDQVYQVADRITVLRDGRRVTEGEVTELPRAELVAHMLGRSLAEVSPADAGTARSRPEQGAPLLEARELGRRGVLPPFQLQVQGGTVLGLAGLLGSGRTELVRLLFGADRADQGALHVDGQRVSRWSPRQALSRGFGYTPEDRKVDGLLPHLSVRENILLALQALRGIFRPLSAARGQEIAQGFVTSLGIRTPHLDQPVSLLSGGNQQKVLLARWLAVEPRLLLLDEPTRGIDVGARQEIERLIADLSQQGMAIVLVSSELEELERTCQAVVVLRDRALVGELAGDEVRVDRMMHAIASHADGR